MLFYFNFDLNEREYQAVRVEYAKIKGEMAQRLHEWMVETSDPILEGFVPLPAGGFANPRNDINPS